MARSIDLIRPECCPALEPLQGSAADIIRRAMVRMDDALAKAKLDAEMLMQVHDELVFEAPDDRGQVDDRAGEEADFRRAGAGGEARRPAGGRSAPGGQLGRGALRASLILDRGTAKPYLS